MFGNNKKNNNFWGFGGSIWDNDLFGSSNDDSDWLFGSQRARREAENLYGLATNENRSLWDFLAELFR